MDKSKEIVWSQKAEDDLMQILEYWYNRNKSIVFPEKLTDEIFEAIQILKSHPNFGRKINQAEFRRVLVRYYLIIYKPENEQIKIIRIIDGRQDNMDI